MNILKKPVPVCLSAFALAGITRPTIIASALKVIGNVPTYIEAYKEVKKSLAQLKVNMECGCVRRQKGKERLQIIISE